MFDKLDHKQRERLLDAIVSVLTELAKFLRRKN